MNSLYALTITTHDRILDAKINNGAADLIDAGMKQVLAFKKGGFLIGFLPMN